MSLQDRAIQTDEQRQSRNSFSLTLKDVLKFMSSMILPLVLGIFTVISTNNQQKEVIRQQERDGSLRLREADITSKQNELTRKLTMERYQDDLLVTYTKDVGELLERSNGSLTSNSVYATIARAKTLNTIRQLDPLRSSNAIRFLYEGKQLTNTNKSAALDISTAKLINIDVDVFRTVTKIGKLSLTGVYLFNCMLNGTSLSDLDFSSAQLADIDFSHTKLSNIVMSSAKLEDVRFTYATLRDMKFSSTEMNRIELGFAKLQDADLSNSQFAYTNISSARLDDVNFSFAKFRNIKFSYTKLSNINFGSAELENVDFTFAEFTEVRFSSARLLNVNFSSAILRRVDFTDTDLSGSDFSSAVLGNSIINISNQ